jgi:hypothetical protein
MYLLAVATCSVFVDKLLHIRVVIFVYIMSTEIQGHALAQLFEALRYKLEGCGFDSDSVIATLLPWG